MVLFYPRRIILWLLIFILIDSPFLFVSTLELLTGGRITGKLINEENDTLFFNSDILGQITVKLSQGKVTDTTTQIESVTKTEIAESNKKYTLTKKSKWPVISMMLDDAPPGKILDSSVTAGYRVGEGERIF